ncbi:hypothetical protein [Galactobacter caseinivorans]|uniref:Uncharacterized protein n=1 Tax=Galactobacter caseinivorans TaxID=2676123 RepID=A0A496PIB4_9MICC|nr:hypothetical protein [Galactobacter caseinivorans]RKW70212.1 hypothetical protein DWQ67_09745 [Galactobacter caseinivorans]
MSNPEHLEYAVESVTMDGRAVRTGQWTFVQLPAHPAAGALIVPNGVSNNPRFRILAVDGPVWSTEDTGIRTMEWSADEGARAVTDLTVDCFAGELVVRTDGPVTTVTNRGVVTTLRRAAPAVVQV